MRTPRNLAVLLSLVVVVWTSASASAALPDRGIFADLDPKVQTQAPAWVPLQRCRDGRAGRIWLTALGSAVALAAGDGAAPPCPNAQDSDGDGLPDPFDILLGGKKVALDAAPYGSPYRTIPYPGGDVPRGEGVCTDVVIRALRNAGLDLQQLLHDDIARAPAAYPMVSKANANIDHRRVKTLLPYFLRHWQVQSTDPRRLADWLPGDVVFMDTLTKPGPDHIGIVSDRLGASGLPLVINSWTDGYNTAEMDLLGSVPVTHRFRAPQRRDEVVAAAQAAVNFVVPERTQQLVVVRTSGPAADRGELTRWQRKSGGWQPIGAAIPVDVGRAGLAWGRGLAADRTPAKREGDGKSPMGAFALGTAFGTGPAPRGSHWPWRRTTADDRWIDDAASPLYNTWANAAQAQGLSSETLRRPDGLYDLALVLLHNTAEHPGGIVRGAGSAIFAHISSGAPTSGCTSMSKAALGELLTWLQPSAEPVWIQAVF